MKSLIFPIIFCIFLLYFCHSLTLSINIVTSGSHEITLQTCENDQLVIRCLQSCSDTEDFKKQLSKCASPSNKVQRAPSQEEEVDVREEDVTERLEECLDEVRRTFGEELGECQLRCRREPKYFICTQDCSSEPFIPFPLTESGFCIREECQGSTPEDSSCFQSCLHRPTSEECLEFCSKNPQLSKCLEKCRDSESTKDCQVFCMRLKEEDGNDPNFNMTRCMGSCERRCRKDCTALEEAKYCKLNSGLQKGLTSCRWRIRQTEESIYIIHGGIVTDYFNELEGDERERFIVGIPQQIRESTTRKEVKEVNTNHFFIDYGMTIKFDFSFSTFDQRDLAPDVNKRLRTSGVHVQVENHNPELINVTSEKVYKPVESLLKIGVISKLQKNNNFVQSPPGKILEVIWLDLRMIGGFENCSSNSPELSPYNHVRAIFHAGCPPNRRITWNWNKTIHTLKFRDISEGFGNSSGSNCWGGDSVCFYKESPVIFHFDIIDGKEQRVTTPYKGNFTLRVVGGGYSKDQMRNYTEEEISQYNFPGVSDSSLIWTLSKPEQLEDQIKKLGETRGVRKELVLTSGKTQIRWACKTRSPCARIVPKWTGQTAYFLKIRISNQGVEDSTLCLYENEFIIHLYGFYPSPEIILGANLIFCVLIILALSLLFICCRNDGLLWYQTKLRMRVWISRIGDKLPSCTEDAEKAKERKGNILLSLQGYLNVPVLPQKSEPNQEESSESPGSGVSSEKWTDLMYQKILKNHLINHLQEQEDLKARAEVVGEKKARRELKRRRTLVRSSRDARKEMKDPDKISGSDLEDWESVSDTEN